LRFHSRNNDVHERKNNMSKENVQKFYELLMNDKAAAEELKKIAAGKDIAEPEKAAAMVVEFAAGKGFDFTAGELAQFEQENQQELTPEELEKINAAGGGYCLGVGVGWGEGYGIGYTKCTIIGKGIGLAWSDSNDLENEEGNRMAKDIVEVVAHAGSKIIGK
jgi:hypothetical protein